MSLVWSDGRPVLIEDTVHSFSADLATDYGAVNSIAEAYTVGELDMSPDAIWRSQPWVRTVVELLASAVATTKIHSYQLDANDDRQRVKDSPLAKLLWRPNPGPVTGYDWRHHLVVDRAKDGRYACYITNVTGTDDGWRLTRVPPRHWKFIRNGMDEPVGMEFTDGRKQSLERTLFFDGYPAKEKSPMDCIRDLLLEESESAAARRDLWKNGARVPHTITRPVDAPDWSPPARANFKRGWAAFAKNGGKSGMTPVLEDGMKLNEVKMLSSADAQQMQARTLSRREVIAFFHVAAQLVGDVDGTNHSNVLAYNEMLHIITLGKWYAELEEGINDRLVPIVAPAGDEFAEFAISEHFGLTGPKRADAEAKELAGVPSVSVNEVRKRRNLPPFSNPIFDEPIIPINIRPPGDSPALGSGEV